MIQVTVAQAVKYLNGLLAADSAAITYLMEYRVPCNPELQNHPTCQVAMDEPNSPSVGLLGVLNGLFGTDLNGWGFIEAAYEDGRIVGFRER